MRAHYLLLMLLLCGMAHGATLVQHIHCAFASASSFTVNSTNCPGLAASTTGNLLTMGFTAGGGNTLTSIVSSSQTWTLADNGTNSGWAFMCNATSTSSIVITPAGATTLNIVFSEWSGTGTTAASCQDITNQNGNSCASSTSWSSNATGALAQANELIFVHNVSFANPANFTCTAPAGCTADDNINNANGSIADYYINVSSTSSVTASGAVTSNATCFSSIGTFKVGASAASATGTNLGIKTVLAPKTVIAP